MKKGRGGEDGSSVRFHLPPLVPPRKGQNKFLSKEKILSPTEVSSIAESLVALTSYRNLTKDQMAFELCQSAIKGLQQLSKSRGAHMVIVTEGKGVFVNLANPDLYWAQAADLPGNFSRS